MVSLLYDLWSVEAYKYVIYIYYFETYLSIKDFFFSFTKKLILSLYGGKLTNLSVIRNMKGWSNVGRDVICSVRFYLSLL